MSTFSIFEIGKSALVAAKRTMDVTSHNVANASTPGYSRQDVLLEPLIQRDSPISGVGVKAAQTLRARDAFIDGVLRSETANKASFAAQKDVLDELQAVVAEPSDNGLRAAIEDFWGAWQDLSVNPSSDSARAALMEEGRSLVDMFQNMSGQIEATSANVDSTIASNVDRVNMLTDQIASLNAEITRAVSRKEPAADLLDKRDVLIDELAEITGATVTRLDDKTQSVRVLVNGFPLVDANNAYKMEVTYPFGKAQYNWVDAAGDAHPIGEVGGRLGGLKQARDGTLASFRADLEGLFKGVVDGVNDIHDDGYTETGVQTGDFFTVGDVNNYLDTVEVNPAIVADPGAIAASADDTDGLNGATALAIADFLETGPVEQWTALIGKLGTSAEQIQGDCDTEELLVKELQSRKDSVSGVSLDEEMANLVREQHAFNAASRLITTADEMIDTIINRMGSGR